MLGKLNQFTESHGELRLGRGLVTGSQQRGERDHDFADNTPYIGLDVLGDYVPNGFVRQLKFPFTWKG